MLARGVEGSQDLRLFPSTGSVVRNPVTRVGRRSEPVAQGSRASVLEPPRWDREPAHQRAHAHSQPPSCGRNPAGRTKPHAVAPRAGPANTQRTHPPPILVASRNGPVRRPGQDDRGLSSATAELILIPIDTLPPDQTRPARRPRTLSAGAVIARSSTAAVCACAIDRRRSRHQRLEAAPRSRQPTLRR